VRVSKGGELRTSIGMAALLLRDGRSERTAVSQSTAQAPS